MSKSISRVLVLMLVLVLLPSSSFSKDEFTQYEIEEMVYAAPSSWKISEKKDDAGAVIQRFFSYGRVENNNHIYAMSSVFFFDSSDSYTSDHLHGFVDGFVDGLIDSAGALSPEIRYYDDVPSPYADVSFLLPLNDTIHFSKSIFMYHNNAMYGFMLSVQSEDCLEETFSSIVDSIHFVSPAEALESNAPTPAPVVVSSIRAPRSNELDVYETFKSMCEDSGVLIEYTANDDEERYDDDGTASFSFVPIIGAKFSITYRGDSLLSYQCAITPGTYAARYGDAILLSFLQSLPNNLSKDTATSIARYLADTQTPDKDLPALTQAERVQDGYTYSLANFTGVTLILTALPQ